VRDADAHFRIGWWALSEIAFDSVRVEFRAQAGRVPYSSSMRVTDGLQTSAVRVYGGFLMKA